MKLSELTPFQRSRLATEARNAQLLVAARIKTPKKSAASRRNGRLNKYALARAQERWPDFAPFIAQFKESSGVERREFGRALLANIDMRIRDEVQTDLL